MKLWSILVAMSLALCLGTVSFAQDIYQQEGVGAEEGVFERTDQNLDAAGEELGTEMEEAYEEAGEELGKEMDKAFEEAGEELGVSDNDWKQDNYGYFAVDYDYDTDDATFVQWYGESDKWFE